MRMGTYTMKKILYVEDHLQQRNIVKQTLELLGDYKVILAKNAEEGLEKARELDPDIILMDLRLPEMTGHEAIEELKKDPNLSDIPIITISAWVNKESREKALNAGAEAVLQKPFDYNVLIKRINRLLSSSTRKTTKEDH